MSAQREARMKEQLAAAQREQLEMQRKIVEIKASGKVIVDAPPLV